MVYLQKKAVTLFAETRAMKRRRRTDRGFRVEKSGFCRIVSCLRVRDKNGINRSPVQRFSYFINLTL